MVNLPIARIIHQAMSTDSHFRHNVMQLYEGKVDREALVNELQDQLNELLDVDQQSINMWSDLLGSINLANMHGCNVTASR